SEQFSVCISLLNVDFKTSGRIEGDEYTGIISWDGVDREYLTFSDVPKYADIAIGDTVVTTNYSAIFPEGLVICTISDFELVNMTSYKAKVRVAARMGALNNVMLIFNRDAEQRAQLENEYYNNNRK
ncbi:MAG: rod shape-determining protein MreC, partial [Rikenellaceae bacterium]|nr:rod shape-determining protein MreC [Rikenellaceae bacterium]